MGASTRPLGREKAECVGPSTYDPGMLLEQLPFDLAVDDAAQTMQSPPIDANFGLPCRFRGSWGCSSGEGGPVCSQGEEN